MQTAILERNIDILIKNVKMLAILETDRYGSAHETFSYLKQSVETVYTDGILINQILSALKPFNFQF